MISHPYIFIIFYWVRMGLQDSLNLFSTFLNFFHDFNLLILLSLLTFIIVFFFNVIIIRGFKFNFKEPESIEIIWTALPCLILITLGWPSLFILYNVEALDFFNRLTLKCIGHQWYWEYNYPNFNIEFDSFITLNSDLHSGDFRLLEVDNSTLLPSICGCRVLVISADVLHAWTLPSMGLKLDANPGRLNQRVIYSITPGIFYGQCSELCGVNHSFIPIRLEFTSPSIFLDWVVLKSYFLTS